MNFFNKEKSILYAASLFIPTWSIPHTIAIRYIAAVAALSLGITAIRNARLAKSVCLPLLFLVIYFTLITFFSDKPLETLRNLWDDWGKGLLFFLVGVCLFAKTAQFKRVSVNLLLGFLFSIPCLIHVVLVFVNFWSTRTIPWGWSGLSTSHGDLGYTALFAAPLLCATLLINLQARRKFETIVSGFLLFANFISILIAQSRGGTLFYLFTIFIFVIFFPNKGSKGSTTNSKSFFFATVIALSTIGLLWASSANKERWLSVYDKLIMGYTLVETVDAFEASCYGQSALNKSDFFLGSDNFSRQKLSKSLDDGDIWRVFGFKTGIVLVQENLMGLDGAKNAYETLMKSKCGAEPHIPLANAHNGWINTALSIGAPGALLFFAFLMISFLVGLSWQRLCNNDSGVSTILCTTCFVWILRPFLDAAQQDQMLEMQFFILGYLVSSAPALVDLTPHPLEKDT